MTDEIDTVTDDELISAYIDGLLPPERRAVLERRLPLEPELKARLDRMMRANAAVRDAYSFVADEPLPDSVLDLLDRKARRKLWVSPVVDLVARRISKPADSLVWPAALAASLILAIGIGFGILVSPDDPGSDLAWLARAGVIEPDTALHAALESGVSGSVHQLGPALRAVPVLSFADRNGEYCRQIEVASEQAVADALACRRNGAWQLEALIFATGGRLDRESRDRGFRPAGSSSSVIDAAIDERIAGDVLDAPSEAALINAGWDEP